MTDGNKDDMKKAMDGLVESLEEVGYKLKKLTKEKIQEIKDEVAKSAKKDEERHNPKPGKYDLPHGARGETLTGHSCVYCKGSLEKVWHLRSTGKLVMGGPNQYTWAASCRCPKCRIVYDF